MKQCVDARSTLGLVELTALSSLSRCWTGNRADVLATVRSGSCQPSAYSNRTSTTTVCKLRLFPSCILIYVYSVGLLTDVIRISDYITSRGRIIREQLLTNGGQGSSCNLFKHFKVLNLMEREIQKEPLREYDVVHPGFDLGISRVHVRCINAGTNLPFPKIS